MWTQNYQSQCTYIRNLILISLIYRSRTKKNIFKANHNKKIVKGGYNLCHLKGERLNGSQPLKFKEIKDTCSRLLSIQEKGGYIVSQPLKVKG